MKRVHCTTTRAEMLKGPDRIAACLDLIKQAAHDRPDLVVLPETCDWDTRVPLAEHLGGPAVSEMRMLQALQDAARTGGVWIAFGAFRRHGAAYANTAFLLDPSGTQVYAYDKTYLTELELDAGVIPGVGAELFDTALGRIAPIICFDLNFAELRTRVASQRPELILFHSQFHGGIQQQAWAYGCRCHFVSAVEGLPSGVLSPTGRVLAATTNYTDTVTCRLNLDCCVAHLDGNGENLKALKLKWGQAVEVCDPGLLGCVEILSRDEAVSARQMALEFEIELLDDYLDRMSRAQARARPY